MEKLATGLKSDLREHRNIAVGRPRFENNRVNHYFLAEHGRGDIGPPVSGCVFPGVGKNHEELGATGTLNHIRRLYRTKRAFVLPWRNPWFARVGHFFGAEGELEGRQYRVDQGGTSAGAQALHGLLEFG